MWSNNKGKEFKSKADAFDWLNNADATKEIDMLRLYCDNDLRYTLNPFGIFDEYTKSYVKGKLSIETYN